MSLGMILRQPRSVLTKLHGLSPDEENRVFEKMTSGERGPDGEFTFSAAECMRRTTQIRNEPVATIRSATALMAIRQEEFLACCREAQDRDREERSRSHNDSKVLCELVNMRLDTLSNALSNPDPIDVRQIAKLYSWPVARIRKYANQGRFKQSLLPGTKGTGKHKKFDPAKVMEDIKAIENEIGKKRRKRS